MLLRPCWFVLLTLTLLGPAATGADDVPTRLARAQASYDRQDFQGASRDADWVLEREPNRFEALLIRGFARLQIGYTAASLADFERAETIRPGNLDNGLGRAQALGQLAEWDRMLAVLDPLIAACPDDARLSVIRAQPLMSRNEWTRARADLDRAVASPFLDPETQTEARARRGLCLLALHEFDPALADLDAALAADSTRTEARGGRAAAAAALRGAGRLDSARSAWRFARAAALLMAGRYDQAITDLGPLATGPERAEILFFRGAARFCQHDYAGTLADWDELIQLEPTAALSWSNRALAHLARKDFATAQRDADEAIRLAPNHPGGWNSRAAVASRQERYAQAVVDQTEAIRLEPGNGMFHANRAGSRFELGDVAGALADLDRAAELDPTDATTDSGRAWIRATAADPRFRDGPQALKLANRAIERTGGTDSRPFQALAAAHAELGDFPRAIAAATRARELPPTDRHVWKVAFRPNGQLELSFSTKLRDEDRFRAELTRALALYRAGQPSRQTGAPRPLTPTPTE